MATRSNIIMQTADGTCRRIYIHFDGYISGVGKTLHKYYNTPDRVNALIELGDLSALYPTLEAPEDHSFDNPAEGVTVAYGRDRGEEGTGAVSFQSLREAAEDHEEYLYAFIEGKWYWTQDYPDQPLKLLADEFEGVDDEPIAPPKTSPSYTSPAFGMI